MPLPWIIVICFAGIACIIAAVGLLLRDVVFGGPRQFSTSISRLPLARDEATPSGITGSIDHAFNRLVIDTGLDCSPFAGFLLVLLLGLAIGGSLFVFNENPTMAALGMIGGMVLALLYLMYLRAKRTRLILQQLPDVLDLLSRAVRAGESLEQGIALIGDKGADPLAREFRRVARHLEMGLSVPAAMRALVFRVPLMEMRIFATTLSVHRQTGGNLPTTLEKMSSVVRDRLAYRQQLRATTAAGRFSALLIAAVGPLLFGWMFFFHPEYAKNLMELPIGQTLMATAVVLEIIGLIWILRLLRTNY